MAVGRCGQIATSLSVLGLLAYRSGDIERSGRLIDEAVARQRAMGDARGLASSLGIRGAIRFAQGDASAALSHYLESLRLLQQLVSTSMSLTAEFLEDLAGVLLARGRPDKAARILGSAVASRTAIGAPALGWRQPAIDRTVAGLRDNLGAGAYEAAWSAGSALSIDRAVAEILDTQL